MAGTTTNGLPYPESTDFVTDGAQAIEDLAVAVNDKAGLWLVKKETVAAGATELIVDSAFTDDHQNYKIEIIIFPSAGVNMFLQLRTGGSNNTNASYSAQSLNVNDTALTGARSTSATAWKPADIYSTSDANAGTIMLYRPKESARTVFYSKFMTSFNGALMWDAVGQFENTTSFDGFRIFTSSGTFSATAIVYGYNN